MKQFLIRKASLTLFCTAVLSFTTTVLAQTSVTVEKAGTLSTVLADTEKNVKVSGKLNGTDMKYLRDMVTTHSLTSIDLSEAQIVSGGVAYYDDKKTENDVFGSSMFFECKKLTSIVLPNSITSIGTNALARTGLRKIEIPSNVTVVEMDAFAYCSSLTSVVVGKRVVKLGQGVFYSSPVSNAYFKPLVPPNAAPYEFSSNPKIHVYAQVLADYKASEWKSYGTLTGDLDSTYPYEKDPEELAAEKFCTYFDDIICTQLKSEYSSMSDESLTEKLTEDGMPTPFIEIIMKIKNDQWAPYEKDFRIHSYKAYSDANYWNDKMRSSGGSFMGNPTGIYVKGTENLYVFVNDDIPSDATLYIAGCIENQMISSATTGRKLTKGMNIVSGTKDALYYILYTANTKAMTKKLNEWPLMNIHIEGGVVNGYYELSRHSDADYKAILKAATHKRFTVKGDEALFHFKTATYRKVWPSTVDKSICWFDSLTVWQKELMGFCEDVALGKRDFYPHNLSGGEAIFPIYYNNPNFAIEGEEADAGWANSSSYRTSYNSQACVKSAFDLTHPESLDDWCAAHECGHNNQGAISVESSTEISNNLFSNMIRFIDGLVTSTGTAPATTMNDYASHTPYYLRSVNARLRMYYQLYLYYHVARRNTAFFPTLFQELRKSPLKLYQSTNNDGGLKFVRTVCKVAQQDLTDFFRAWGFFEAGKLNIEDYGSHTINVRQTDINKTLAEISQYPTKNREILFIEDRITDVLSYGFPTKPGQKRRESEKIGQCGDMGQFTDFMNPPAAPSSYTYLQTDSLYCMIGTGGVGFVVMDSEDKLLYGSNCRSFSIPSSIGTDFTIYSIDSDGTLHPTEKCGEAVQVVEMAKAGTLDSELSSSVAGAKVSGPVNGTDMKCLRNLAETQNLISLDLSGALIKQGGTSYYKSLRTATNVFPEALFYNCKKLQNIQLPETIIRVGKQALAESGVKKVEIPNTVTTLEMDACAYCDNLTEVVLGEKVRTMEQGVFYSSPVKDVYVKSLTPPTLSSYAFSSNPIIHVHKSALAKYQSSAWANYGTIVGDLDEWEEANANSLISVESDEMAITVDPTDGQLQLSGLHDRTAVCAYTIDGALIATTTVANGRATLNLSAWKGKIVVIKAGNECRKLFVKE